MKCASDGGGSLAGDPAVGGSDDGRLEVFGRGFGNDIVHGWQVRAIGTFWSGWNPLSGTMLFAGTPVVVRNLGGRLQAFARTGDGGLWHISQLAPSGTWGTWLPLLISAAGDPAVNQLPDGRLTVFLRGPLNALLAKTQAVPGSGAVVGPPR